ncbi:LysR substrate-binding domain-containing protein [Pseudomonas putida]|uniref:LysR substrate-binding domain-containing protein n=1 Tax=Pseudomonas putida TaxID=303 RepID=UPI00300F5285
MELRHLRYFVALAEELSFTRAAHRLHISQPPLSTQIAQLEFEVGVALFTRTSRHVELTAAGEAFLNDARVVLDHIGVACDRARAVGSGYAGRIEIGLSGSHFQGPLPKVVARYMESNPLVSVVLHESKPAAQLDDLRNGRIDLSVSRTPVNDGVLKSSVLFEDPIYVALHREHPLAGRGYLSLFELSPFPFVMLRGDSSAFAQLLHQCCVQAGFEPQVLQWVVEVPAIVNLVAAGIGVGLVPKSVTGIGCEPLEFVPLIDGAPPSSVYVLQRIQESRHFLLDFVELLLRDACAEDD